MARALALAARGLYTTTPNPRVGCVIVTDGAVIGEGWHERAGEPHAEVNALADARARGARPARRHAVRHARAVQPRTAARRRASTPCIAAGIARVVAAMRDPNPRKARRRGAAARRRHRRSTSACSRTRRASSTSASCRAMTRGRPWVRMKVAASLDGRTALANGESQWITGAAARADGHRWRARACAILTGIGTVLQDDPAAHRARGRDAAPAAARSSSTAMAQTPATARVLAGGDALIVTAGERNAAWPADVEVLRAARRRRPRRPRRADARAGRRAASTSCTSRRARKLNGALLAAGLVDELLLYLAPCAARRSGARHVRARARRSRALADRDRRSRGTTSSASATTCASSRASRTEERLMFTGIVQAVGRIAARRAAGRRPAHRGRHRRARRRRRRGRRQHRASTAAA